jgi:hypothetical protein
MVVSVLRSIPSHRRHELFVGRIMIFVSTCSRVVGWNGDVYRMIRRWKIRLMNNVHIPVAILLSSCVRRINWAATDKQVCDLFLKCLLVTDFPRQQPLFAQDVGLRWEFG